MLTYMYIHIYNVWQNNLPLNDSVYAAKGTFPCDIFPLLSVCSSCAVYTVKVLYTFQVCFFDGSDGCFPQLLALPKLVIVNWMLS